MTIGPSHAPGGLSGRVLDTPAILDLATGRTNYMRAVAYMATVRGDTLAVPAAALAQAAATAPAASDHDQLTRAITADAIVLIGLDQTAIEVGALAAKLRLSVPAAHVAYVAGARRWTIITRTEDAAAWRGLGYQVDVLP